MKKKEILLIISVICPIVGIVLYFINKNSKYRKEILLFSIIGFVIYSVILLIYSTKYNYSINKDAHMWKSDISKGQDVVTVFGASYCSHCKELKPVIFKIAKKNNINLYYYELDKLDNNSLQILMKSFDIGSYNGSVPYIFIMRNIDFVDKSVGYKDEKSLTDFLRKNQVLKN